MKTLRDDQAFALEELRHGAPDAEFRPVPGYARYFVGDRGTIISLVRSGRVLRQTLSPQGYFYVSLMGADGKPVKHLVHRLVAEAFVENPAGLDVVNHLDGVKTNNVFTNLEWCTYSENNNHARRTGLSLAIGETHYAAKVTVDDVHRIRALAAEGVFHREIGQRFGLTRKHVTKIVNRHIWAAV